MFAVFLLIFLPTINLKFNDDLSLIYGTFVGEKSKYQGIIEIWNIDTFESGSKSKSSYLNEVALDFQKKFKGCYVMVRNLTEIECGNLIKSGEFPDLFSCSYGVAEKIKPYLQKFDNQDFNLRQNFLTAGKVNEELFGVAWCCGLYSLISTKKSLENAKVLDIDNVSMIENAFNLGYSKTGKKTKLIYSLSFSEKNYLMPLQAIKTYNDKEEFLISELSFNTKTSFSQYDAYINFLLGNSTLLLGSQRDIVRIEKRESNGKIQDVIIEPLLKFSDLVQFMFLAKTEDSVKFEYIQKFVKFLTNEKNQLKVANMNMFPTTKIEFLMQNKYLKTIKIENLENIFINNAFIEISEIKKLQQTK